ncbi:MAG: DUF2891 domain-containing protein [Bryobacteraceae bacterium]
MIALLALLMMADFDQQQAARFAQMALDCVHKEYPNKLAHSLESDADVKPPRALTPAFYGCYDWHSSVHGHWLLARLARSFPRAEFAPRARAELARSLTPANIAAEAAYLNAPGRASFERPYGLAWLLQLAAELRQWNDTEAKRWAAALTPLERAAVERLSAWLPKLSRPVRSGEHSQTAFALGLMLDWARVAGDAAFRSLLESRSLEFYAADTACPLHYEPSGEDFLSPCLAEADVMRRVLPPARFAAWLSKFLPSIAGLGPAVVTDPGDPKLVHLAGLNLSRAWMLSAIAKALPAGDARRKTYEASAATHRKAGLAAITDEHYEGGHWLGTFAAYCSY